MGYAVRKISRGMCEDFVLRIHYAHRWPSISYAYGLFIEGADKSRLFPVDLLVGVVTYGEPASPPLCIGVCGEEYKDSVLELNRLVLLNNGKNEASRLVGASLRLLKEEGNFVVVSFADTGMTHFGYVYQATNFLYTGPTKERTDKYTENGKHSRHYKKDKDHLRKVRTSKHRYIYFVGDKRYKKAARANLRYGVEEYPKGDTDRYSVGDGIVTKIINTSTGEEYFE